ncbi:MAG: hypothetical protein D6B26_07605 [Spirochaetaceae bacterium]|nr:MAG: hypothetical protein D6B26_07605 [Spirochaetaceae bacterium]
MLFNPEGLTPLDFFCPNACPAVNMVGIFDTVNLGQKYTVCRLAPGGRRPAGARAFFAGLALGGAGRPAGADGLAGSAIPFCITR